MSLLNRLTSTSSRSKKRVGRGNASGKGMHTAGRGQKGQKSRKGNTIPLWFEGGQLPLIKRLPMQRGKGRLNVVRPTAEVSLSDLNNMQATTITLDALKLEKIIDHRFKKAKIVKSGDLKRKITVQGIPVTAGARQVIENQGGSIA